jgi:hypothetical protein
MKFIEILNLPSPTDQIRQRAYHIVNQWHYQQKFIVNLKQHVLLDHDTNVVSAGQAFDDILNQMVKNQYQSFFEFPVEATVSFFKNSQAQPACLPPHTHPNRTVAIEYFFETGNDARTVLYDFNETCGTSKFMDYYDYRDVTYNTHARFEKEKWYMFNNRTPHSVEDVYNRRMFIAFTFDPQHTIESVLHNSKLEYKMFEKIE